MLPLKMNNINLDLLTKLPGVFNFILPCLFTFGIHSSDLKSQSNKPIRVDDEHQEYETLYHENGSVLNGTTLYEDETSILFRLYATSDTISIEKIQLLNEDKLEELAFKHTIQENAGVTPTAFNLKKGEQRYRNVYLLYNDYSRGITDKLSFTAGFALHPEVSYGELAGGVTGRIKYSHKLKEKLSVAIAPSFIYNSYEESVVTINAASVTLGDPTKFLNIGGSLINDLSYGDTYFMLSLGGGLSLSDKISIVTDNIITNLDWDTILLTSLMCKYLYKNKHQMQIGLYHAGGIPIPIFSYAYFWKK